MHCVAMVCLCGMVVPIVNTIHKELYIFLAVHPDMCAKNSHWCCWGAEWRVKLAQTRKRGPHWCQLKLCKLIEEF